MLKTSLFSKGIYKSNLARFKWGSFLYFIILFFSTSFIFLINDYGYMTDEAVNRHMLSGGMILRDDYLIFPMLVASFVPTVTVFLAFDMFSSKMPSNPHKMAISSRVNKPSPHAQYAQTGPQP